MNQGRGLRVIAGRHRGRRLETPPGLQVRPTGDRVREALFSMLQPRLYGARVVDAFAGTGALGIEALSRGAAEVVFLESHGPTQELIRRNLERLSPPPRARVIQADALRVDRWGGGVLPVDLILADPPYRGGVGVAFLEALAGSEVLVSGGQLVLEHDAGDDPGAPDWDLVDRRVHGDTGLSFFTPAQAGLSLP